ncbi:Lactonase, 7-bladed beta-propeller-domain-containing protein [Syncephalastrum racemosum]|uniref:Lactonase, 7-bladed beta-propeller-domain-containing protein n=1 Tax=Syncephalastrum racemosum TaxID=13706 RepID=A0A1X2HPX8_SYNRA|nr:Lactonase, 7-bladed beta-propeller-domain-containing protein [Syncephalastrum racemosum]
MKILRGLLVAIIFTVVVTCASESFDSIVIYVSGYTTPKGGGEGIYRYTFDRGRLRNGELIATGLYNPSWIVMQDNATIHAVSEIAQGRVTTLERRPARWMVKHEASSGGDGPVHLAPQPHSHSLWVANYASGTTAAIDLQNYSTTVYPPPVPATYGVPGRQASAHAHVMVFLDDNSVATCDLVADQVYIRDITTNTIVHSYTFKNGTGPRHLVATADHIYVDSELTSQVFVLSKDLKELKQSIDCLPPGFDGIDTSGEIALHRGFLYVSLRGYNGIAIFRVGEDGLLTLVGHDPSGGRTPRHFSLHGDHMIVANQDSHNLVVFKVLPSGRIKQLHSVHHPEPTCVQWDI